MTNPPTKPPPTDARVYDDDEQERECRAQIAAEIAAVVDDDVALIEAARGYFRLRQALMMHMGDLTPWIDRDRTRFDQIHAPREYPVDRTGAEVAELELYIAHLSMATHGPCEYCDRAIHAHHPFVHVHRARWWHPRVWGRAFMGALRTIVNAGDYQLAHPQCAGEHACTTRHGE